MNCVYDMKYDWKKYFCARSSKLHIVLIDALNVRNIFGRASLWV